MSSSQTLYALIKQLADKKIQIWLEGEALKFKAPKDALDAELKNLLIAHKPALIDFLKEQAQSTSQILPRTHREELPISNAQQRLWFIEQYNRQDGAEKSAYNIPVALHLSGALNITALQYAIDTLVARHEVLQTYFENKNGLPVQKKIKDLQCQITINDLTELSEVENDFQSQQIIEENIAYPFNLSTWPLFKLDLIKKAENEFMFLATMHHIIADAWSMSVLIKEIASYYESFIQQGAIAFSPHPLQYADFAAWQREYLDEARSQSLLSFWSKYLENSSVLELPLDKKRLSAHAAQGKSIHFTLDADLQKQLNDFASKQGVTLFMLLLASFNILLSRFARQTDISIGVPVANRNRPEWEIMIGFFVNTLVLRSDLSGDPKFSQFLKQVQENTLAIYSKQEFPFDRLVETLVKNRDSYFSPLFQVMFSLQNTPGEQKINLSNLDIEVLDNHLSHSRFDMTWNLTEQTASQKNQGIDIDLEYNSELFKHSTIVIYLYYFEYLLKQIVTCEDQVLSAYLLQSSEATKNQALAFNPQASDYPKEALIVEVFDKVAKQHKHAIAISDAHTRITYQQLSQSVNQIAAFLQRNNIKQGDRIIIVLQRSVEMVQAILAVLKLGACYVPVDPDYPAERKHYILNDSQAKLLLCSKSKSGNIDDFFSNESTLIKSPLTKNSCVFLEDIPKETEFNFQALSKSSSAVLPACIFYTSGSTGEPKGVIIPHRAIVRLVCNTNFASFGASEVVAHVSNVCFDAASMEIWGALLNGGRLHIVDQDILLSAKQFAETLVQHNISLMFLTTGLFRVYAQENPRMFAGLTTLLFGGETVDLAAVQQVLNSGAAPRQLIHVYGPTENTTFSTAYVIKEISAQQISVPIGTAIANSQVFIANSQGQLVPAGIEGELICAGDGLALAYLNKPSITQEKFVAGFLPAFPQQRVYLTGDLARYSPEGEIILSGRLDEQIKLRGYRIEPGEIKYVLEHLPGVKACSVLLKQKNLSERSLSKTNLGEKSLVAYIVFEDSSAEITDYKLSAIRELARAQLPAYMMPAFFVEIDSVPLNANGKVDKKKLPDPNWQEVSGDEYQAPSDELEERLSEIWSNLLMIDRPSVKANFFDLGGHSLLATQMVSRIYDTFFIELNVKDIFENPSIYALSEFLRNKNNFYLAESNKKITRVDRTQAQVLSKAQQRLWFIYQLNKESSAYGMPMTVSIKGNLELKRLERSLNTLMKRHESLRTRFIVVNNEVKQIIDQPKTYYSLPLSSIAKEADIEIAIKNNQKKIFNLERGALFFFELIERKEQGATKEYLLLMNMHHIISDGWSMKVLQEDLLSIYQTQGEDHLPELEIQYIDYSVWQAEHLNEARNTALLNYWLAELSNVAQVLHLPTDRKHPETQNLEGAVIYHALNKTLQERALAFCKEQQLTSFVLGLSAYAVLLAKYSQQHDFCIGVPVSGRQQKSLEPIIGFFVNGLVIRSDLRERLSVEEFLNQNKEKVLAAFAHQDLSADVLIEALGIKPNPRHQPLAQVAFSHQSYREPQNDTNSIEGVNFEVLPSENKNAKYELILSLSDSGSSLSLACEYATALFDHDTISNLLAHYEFLLSAMIENPSSRVDEISWYGEQDILFELNKHYGDHNDKHFEKAYPLSANQQAIYLDALINPNTIQNSIANFMEFSTAIDKDRWKQAFEILQSKHDVLRTALLALDMLGEHKVYQAIRCKAPKSFSYHDLSGKNISFSDLPKYLEKEAYCTYAIEKGPLYHYSLYKLKDNSYATMLRAHHILFDGVSGKVFLEEIVQTYQALLNHETFVTQPDNFYEFIADQNKVLDQKPCLDFWRLQAKELAGLSFNVFLEDKATEKQFVQKEYALKKDISLAIRKYCRKKKITPAIFFKCLYVALIEHYCRPETDFFIREYSHGRNKEYEKSYGVFYQQTPFIVPLDLFSHSHFNEDLFSALFLHAANFQKQSRQWRDFSIQSQALLFPNDGIGFMYNYTHFESSVEFMGKQEKTVFLSPRAERQVQLFIRERDEDFELLLLYGNDYFYDYEFLARFSHLAEQLLLESGSGSENKSSSENTLSLLQPHDYQILNHLRGIDSVNSEQAISEHAHKEHLLPDNLGSAHQNNKIALHFADKKITYADLNHNSDALACYLLREFKIEKAQRIALYLPLNENYLIALLAIIKAGGSYVPVQVNYPIDRVKQIIGSANSQVIITESSFKIAIEDFSATILALDEIDTDTEIDTGLLLTIKNSIEAQQNLYSIFTSGSTGLPKGAQVSFQGELNLLAWYERILALNESDKSIVISAPSFDLTQKNLFALLRCGGSLVFPDMEVFDPSLIRKLIEQEHVTHINCAPSAFYALLEGGESAWQQLASLRWVVLGGEAILISELSAWHNSEHCHAKVMNSYGPTECSDVVSFYILEQDDYQNYNPIPLGVPIDNTRLYVLNNFHQQVPAGLVGEIAIAGACVGLGYIEQTKLNQEQFIEIELDTLQGKRKEKVYLSGDLGRVNTSANVSGNASGNISGMLEYLGRKDFQIKLRGQRIELSEIENALRSLEGIRDALVLLQGEYLIAYVTPVDAAQMNIDNTYFDSNEMLKSLAQSLPVYMLPTQIILLKAWPLNANGKIDRKALPAADFSLTKQRDLVLPRNEIEHRLYEIWCEVLAISEMSVFDSFFELGGHSLLATKVVSRIKEHFGVEFPLRALFDLHSIADIAGYIKSLLWALDSKEKSSVNKNQENRDEGFL